MTVQKIVRKILEYGHLAGSNDDVINDTDVSKFTGLIAQALEQREQQTKDRILKDIRKITELTSNHIEAKTNLYMWTGLVADYIAALEQKENV